MHKKIIFLVILLAVGFAVLSKPIGAITGILPGDAQANAQSVQNAQRATSTVARADSASSAVVSQAADAPSQQAQAQNNAAARPVAAASLARISIPSIALNDPIQPLGLNSLGQMDVPDGSTSNVGWYEYGTVPGNIGSAVFDAHVFAAFLNLNKVKAGDDIYVTASDGAIDHFRVYETDTYAIADVPLQRLFNDATGRYLNLITCAGKLTPDHSTYDHRLVVYAELVS